MFYRVISSSGHDDWENWDEATEGDFASAARFVTVFNAAGAGDDETGAGGGLSGANLVWTETGTVAGVSGGYRLIDGSDDRFDCTQTAAEIITGQSQWSIMFRIKTPASIVNNDIHFQFYQSDECLISSSCAAGGAITWSLYDDDAGAAGQENLSPADSMAVNTEYYMFIGCDGTANKAFFHPVSSGKPYDISHVDSTKVVTFVTLHDNIGTIATRRIIGSDTSSFGQFYIKWFIIATECLITF